MSQTTTPPTNKVKTRILIISDTHTAPLQPSTESHIPFRHPLPKADVLLHCGDLTQLGRLNEYEKALEVLESIDADLKLVIAGNHDISLDEPFFARRGWRIHRLKDASEKASVVAKARDMWLGERATRAGITYLDEGTYSFTLRNGARLRVYASPYTPEFCDFAFPYHRREDRFNPADKCAPGARPGGGNPVPEFPAVDVMMTHGPPMGILDRTVSGPVGCEHLLRAARRAKPKVHCFGHIHEGWGAERVVWREGTQAGDLDVKWEKHVEKREKIEVDEERMKKERAVMVDVSGEGGRGLREGKETLMVNASIMSVRYKPVQGPWLVDLDLEKAEEKKSKHDEEVEAPRDGSAVHANI